MAGKTARSPVGSLLRVLTYFKGQFSFVPDLYNTLQTLSSPPGRPDRGGEPITQDGQKPSIHFAEIDVRSRLHDDGAFVGFYKLGNCTVNPGYGTLSYKQHCKAMIKSRQAAALLARLLSSTIVDRHHSQCKIDDERTSATVGDTIITADENFVDGQEIHAHTRNIIMAIQMRFPNAIPRHLKSTQYLQISCPNLKSDDTLFNQQGAAVYDSIDIVSGICLFNHYIIKVSLLGSADPSILRTAPTLHELEYLARSPSAIADVAALLISRTRERNRCTATKITIGLDIPSFQNYHFVLEVFDRSSCTSKTALVWIDVVDLRRDQTAEFFTTAIQ
ncbi:MAG: hypothetical protein Q9199_007080 [Rusavskia elegans]